MATIGGVKMANMAKPKVSLKPGSVGKETPDPFSYNHRITLDQDALDKMGVAGTPKVGDVFHVLGQGHVHSVSSDATSSGKSLQVGIQLRKLGMKPKSNAKDAAPKSGALEAVNKGIKEAGE